MTKEQWNSLTNGEKAWKLGLVMKYMNNEEAYYNGWLYFWPDGESYEQCLDDFRDDESYKELEEVFINHYKYEEYHNDGLFDSKGVPSEVVDVAHFWDKELGLKPIEVIK